MELLYKASVIVFPTVGILGGLFHYYLGLIIKMHDKKNPDWFVRTFLFYLLIVSLSGLIIIFLYPTYK